MRDTTVRRGHGEHRGDKQHRGLKGAPETQVRQKSQGTQGTHGDTGHKGTVTSAPMGTSLRAEQATLCK